MRKFLPHIILFCLTAVSTFLIGGPVYSVTLMAILLAHEMGHYFSSKYHRVSTSLPYFIPFPFPPFGTLGAIIKSKSPIPNRKALLDIGVSGPLGGLFLALPAIGFGLLLSKPVPLSQLPPQTIKLSSPPFFLLLQKLVLGDIPEGYDVILHPMAYAGWVGLFVTALNLLPIGQLDGGHVMYALFGPRSRWIFQWAMIGLMLTALFVNLGWLLLIVLISSLGWRHPPPIDDLTPLDFKRKILGIVTICLFFSSFTPVPFPQWAFGLRDLLKELGLWRS